uniref:NADH dehydrogenase subunit 2 n=1 Tax=Lithoredo abatanica TaxID=2586797 RepID=UPI00202770AD|nr:NADH dehydrogenase subunit 2 [Lithoredo abatanica]UPX89234.1 NADH dehydrogenase subunit 2 [Lithoredo abatanica]UPX89246.1 NADH dehydrogenase subunit 2 [Lithoredo abatanica]
MVGVNSFSRLGPAFVFFVVFNVVGVVMVMVSGGLLGVYVGFECAFLGMVAILVGESAEENESCMKYFVFQALGSVYMLAGFVIFVEPIVSVYWAWGFTILGVCLKAGFFPFHYWVPSVLATCSWFSCFLLTVWQKVGLMCFIAKWGASYELFHLLEFVSCATGVLGGVGGIGVVFYRALIGYSSLVHGGWMILASLLGVGAVMFYLVVYALVSGSLMYRLHETKVMCFEDFCNLDHQNGTRFFMIFVDFLSLSGLPSLPGFLPKCMVLMLVGLSHPVTVFCLILSSLLSLYYYLKVAFVAVVGVGVNQFLFRYSTGGLFGWFYSFVFRWNSIVYVVGLVGLVFLVLSVG